MKYVTKITLSKESITLASNGTYQLTASVSPDDATNRTILWESDDPSVADVNDDGLITAKAYGCTYINACATDGSGVTASCYVWVGSKMTVDSVDIPGELHMVVGESTVIPAFITPEDAPIQDIEWTTEYVDDIVSITPDTPQGNGYATATIHALRQGSTTIYARSLDNSLAMDGCVVYVEEAGEDVVPVESIELETKSLTMSVGTSSDFTVTVTPSEATYSDLTWETDTPDIIKISQSTSKKFKLKALFPGTVEVTFIAGGVWDTLTVKVTQTTTEPVETEPSTANPNSTTQHNTIVDPIDVFSGAQVIKNDLISLFGGLGLTLSAHYNSTKLVNGSLGKGWYHNYEKHMVMGDCEAKVYDNPSTFNNFACCVDGQLQCTTFGKNGYTISECYDGQYPYVLDCNLERQEYYCHDGRLGKIVDRHGFETLITYTGNTTVITDTVSGRCIYAEKDTDGRIVRVHDGLGRQTTLEYDGDLLAAITDVNGNTLSYCYDSDGRVLCGTDAENVTYFENTYDNSGRIVSQKDAVSGSAPTVIEYLGNTRISTNRNGCKSTRVYNDLGLLTSFTDENGSTKRYSYDDNGNLVSVTDALGQAVKTVCNSFNKPLSLTDKNGNVTKYTYDQSGNVLKVVYPNGSYESFEYNGRNQVISHTDRRGTVTLYTYDTNGMPCAKKVGDKKAVQYSYSEGLLMLEKDALDNQSTYCYNIYGQPVTKTDALGNETHYEYDNSGNVLRAIDANGGEVSYTYDGNYCKRSFTDANGNTTYYRYNGNLKPTVTTLPDGNTVRHEYDGEDRLVATYDQLNNCTVTDYDSAGRVTAKHDAEGYCTEFCHDAVGNIVSEVNQNGGTTLRTYDANGNLLTVTDAEGNTTRHWYDSMSKLIRTVDALGGATVYKYSQAGDLLSVTDASGNTVTYEYDDYGNKVKETDANGNVKQFVYDANNNLTVTIDAQRNVTTHTYDSCNRLVSVTNAEDRKVCYEYDALGNRIAVTDAKGNTVRTTYDANGNILCVTDAKGNIQTAYEYNELNLAVAVIDAIGNTTEYCYNGIGKTCSITDALGHSKQFIYDRRGNNTDVIDALGNRSSMYYNGLGNVTSIHGPTGAKTQYTYDSMGRLVAETNTMNNVVRIGYNELNRKESYTNGRGQKHRYTYDAMGRMRAHVKPEDDVSYTYDKNGNLLTVTDKNGTISREYDELNRVTKYTDTFGNEIGYEYDKIGNLIKLTYPDGTAVKYTYDANNNMTSVTDWAGRVTRYTYDENNLVTKVVKPDKSVTTTTYDTAHRITSSVERRSTGSLISGYKYTFDDLGRISTESCLDKGTKFWYTYDSLSRIVHKLTTDLYGNHMYEESYEYDAAGNIRYTTDNCCEENSYSYTSNNRLKSYNGYNVGFDEDGNMLYFYQDGTKCSLTYDSSNRLLSAKSCKYTYNAENTRIKKVYGSTATTYVYNTVAKLSQLLVMKKGSTITKYVYGLGLIGEECNGAFKTYHFDYRGSTVALTNINGVVTNIFTYDTYGKLTEGSSSVTPFLYNGRDGVITDENGLYYMRARYYSPDLRRFVNADIVRGAISDSTSLNRYAYVNGNPVSNIDPLGLCHETLTLGSASTTTFIEEFDESINYYTAIFVANKTGKYTSIVGHTELYFLGDNGSWVFTEFNGNVKQVIEDKSTATVRYHPISDVNDKNYPKMYNSATGEFIELENYDYVVLTGDFKDSVRLAYEYHYHINGKDFGDYNLLLNNCSDYTDMLLDVAKIDGYLTQRFINSDSLISIPAIREIQTSFYREADSYLNTVYEKVVDYGEKFKKGAETLIDKLCNIDDIIKDAHENALFGKLRTLWFN